MLPVMKAEALITEPSGEPDEILLQLIRQGDHLAFSRLVNRHAERFYRVAYRFTGNRQEAEDVVQESLIKLWERPDMWDESKNAKFTTWFYRIIVNRSLDAARRKKTSAIDDVPEMADGDDSAEEKLAERQTQSVLEREIRQLPDRQQTAINLCFYEGLSNHEAASVMGLHLKALQSLIMRAKQTLRERMKAYG